MDTIKKKMQKNILLFANKNGNIELTDELSLVKDLGYDSLSLVQLVVVLENEFDIVFEGEYLNFDKIIKIGNLYNTIINLLNESQIECKDDNENNCNVFE